MSVAPRSRRLGAVCILLCACAVSTPPAHPTEAPTAVAPPPPTPPRPTWHFVETSDGPRVEFLDADFGEWRVAGEWIAELDLDGVEPAELVLATDHHWSGTDVQIFRETQSGWTSVFGEYLFGLRTTPAARGRGMDLLVFRDEEDRWRSSGPLTCTRYRWDASGQGYIIGDDGNCRGEHGTPVYPTTSR